MERDIVLADTASDLPIEATPSKHRVLNFLKELHDADSRQWTSRKTIAVEAQISPVYTNNVLSKLIDEDKIEFAHAGRKVYYRFKPA